MARVSLNKFSLYKYRYWIGYSLLAFLLVATMVVAATLVPGGFDVDEQTSALKSASLKLENPTSFLIIDLPYHALQKLSIYLLGLSSFSIKLPSVILSVLSIIGLVFVCRKWFSPNISVVAATAVASFTSFIYVAQHGTPDIMHIFWPVLILFLFNLVPRAGAIGWIASILVGLAVGLNLMTPIGFLPVIAIAIGGLLHPHVRYVIRKKVDVNKRAAIGLSFVVGIIPLVMMLIRQPDTALALIFKDSFDGSLLDSAKDTFLRLFDFTGSYSDVAGTIVPVFTIATLSICVVGYYALFKKKHTAQHYILTAWLILLIPATLFAIENVTYFLLVPFGLLFAAGIQFILRQWYKLFPQNPYARVFGLLPMVVLLTGLIGLGTARYVYSYTYHPVLANSVTHDLRKVNTAINQEKDGSTSIIISANKRDLPFYQLYVDVNDVEASVQTDVQPDALENSTVIALRGSPYISETEVAPLRIVASGSLHERSDRLYIYKKISE